MMKRLILVLLAIFVAAPAFAENSLILLRGARAKTFFNALGVDCLRRDAVDLGIYYVKEVDGVICYKSERPFKGVSYFCRISDNLTPTQFNGIYDTLTVVENADEGDGWRTKNKVAAFLEFKKEWLLRPYEGPRLSVGEVKPAVSDVEVSGGKYGNAHEIFEALNVTTETRVYDFVDVLKKETKSVGGLLCKRECLERYYDGKHLVEYRCGLSADHDAKAIYDALSPKKEEEVAEVDHVVGSWGKSAGNLLCEKLVNASGEVTSYRCRMAAE